MANRDNRNANVKMKKRKQNRRKSSRRNEIPAKIDLGHLSDLIGYALRRAQLAVFRDFLKSFSAVDIRPTQYGVLTVIEQNSGLMQSQVCAALGIRQTNFVALLNALERRGLTRRQRSASDRRSRTLYLTRKGEIFMRDLRRINRVHEERVTSLLGEQERRRLVQSLNRIIAAAKNDS